MSPARRRGRECASGPRPPRGRARGRPRARPGRAPGLHRRRATTGRAGASKTCVPWVHPLRPGKHSVRVAWAPAHGSSVTCVSTGSGAAAETAEDYTAHMDIQTLLILVAGLLVLAVVLLLVLVLRRPGGAADQAM